jgi:DNA-binding HxlR family transcriptional regulator
MAEKEIKEGLELQKDCLKAMVPVRDSLDVLNGKWKLPILITLRGGKKRFNEFSKEIPGITDKVLSKELKELEAHQLITRTVHETFPPTVEYAITEHFESLTHVIIAMRQWGLLHRKRIIGK